MPEEIKRLYRITDTSMLQDSQTTAQLFQTDLALFTAYDPTLTAAFHTAWLSAITTAQAVITDEQYRDQITVKTQTVKDQMKLCSNKYNEVKYFVLKAFPGNIAIQNEFGLDNYDSARQSDIKLQEFMQTMHAAAVKYTAELTNPLVGYTAAKIAQIQTLGDSLDTKNIDQEVFIKNQGTTTQDRVIKMNAVWASRTLVAAAAKIVFLNNFAKYQQYLLPPSEAAASDLGLTGTVTEQATGQPLVGAQAKIVQLNVTELTDEFGKYGFADNLAAGTYTLEISAAGYQTFSTQVTIISSDETVVVNAALVV